MLRAVLATRGPQSPFLLTLHQHLRILLGLLLVPFAMRGMTQAILCGISWQLRTRPPADPLTILACQLLGTTKEVICQLVCRGRGLLVRLRLGQLSSQSQGVAVSCNWACVCTMETPAAGTVTTALQASSCVPSPPESLFPRGFGAAQRSREPGLASPKIPPTPHGATQLTSQVQVAHLHPVLGSLGRRGQPGEMLCPAMAPQHPSMLSARMACPRAGCCSTVGSGPREVGRYKGHPHEGY